MVGFDGYYGWKRSGRSREYSAELIKAPELLVVHLISRRMEVVRRCDILSSSRMEVVRRWGTVPLLLLLALLPSHTHTVPLEAAFQGTGDLAS